MAIVYKSGDIAYKSGFLASLKNLDPPWPWSAELLGALVLLGRRVLQGQVTPSSLLCTTQPLGALEFAVSNPGWFFSWSLILMLELR